MADGADRVGAEQAVIGRPVLSPEAHYAGRPIAAMSRDELLDVLAVKLHELKLCYAYMTPRQVELVAARLRVRGLV